MYLQKIFYVKILHKNIIKCIYNITLAYEMIYNE
jgi:hypothetical protein